MQNAGEELDTAQDPIFQLWLLPSPPTLLLAQVVDCEDVSLPSKIPSNPDTTATAPALDAHTMLWLVETGSSKEVTVINWMDKACLVMLLTVRADKNLFQEEQPPLITLPSTLTSE